MSADRPSQHTLYHPRWFRRRIPIFWWLGHFRYSWFIVRELTSLFVAYGALLLLTQVWALSRGADAYGRFLDQLASPAVVAFHVVVLAALLFHSLTWLALAPKALVVRVAGRRVPDGVIVAAHYGAWLGVSALLAWFLL